jgi:quinol-cytochrome oxidoreductase complex cytochrome b subunit
MAQRVETRPATTAAPRPRRAREEELLVWPDLVFVEFISAVLFTLTLTLLSAAINGPLLDQANPDVTPNPSKAPWYFLNLQELLLHMHPALAGVIVPTVALILLAAIPYFDRSNEGQGVWFGTPDAGRITWLSAVYAAVLTWLLVLYDGGKHVVLYHKLFNRPWPEKLNWLQNLRALQTAVAWPDWTKDIPYLPFTLELRGQEFRTLDLPAFLVEQFIPVATMIGLPVLLLLIIRRWLGRLTRRDAMIALFTGFITVYVVLTIIGTAFRGQGLELLPPWQVHPPE